MDPNAQPTPPPTQTPPAPASTPTGSATPPAPATPTPPKPEKAYSKRPMWQWAVLYVVAAVILYGIVYFVFIRKSGSTATGY